MRRYEREMTDKAEMETVLTKATVVHLAMVDDGRPYVVPLNFGYADGPFTYLPDPLARTCVFRVVIASMTGKKANL